MTKKEWMDVIKSAIIAKRNHTVYLKLAEEEYFRRNGVYPSEVDDDFWIAALHYRTFTPTTKNIKELIKKQERWTTGQLLLFE